MNSPVQALRRLLKAPGFTLAAVVTLALGIGANTVVFSVMNTALLRPLPYPQAERLLQIRERQPEFSNSSIAMPNYEDLKSSQKTLDGLAIFRSERVSLASTGIGGEPELLRGGRVSWDYLSVLGLAPRMGRNFLETEDQPGGPKAIIVSENFFQRRFGGNAAMLGRTLVINGEPYELIGVLPANFEEIRRADALITFNDLRKSREMTNRGNHPGLSMLGRMKPGVTIEQVRADLDTTYAALEKQYPDHNTGVSSTPLPLLESRVGSYTKSLFLLLGATACVLLIACANVANLLLARAVGRQKEFAIRAALGAGRAQLMRELFAENNLLALGGALGGLAIAYWTRDLIFLLAPSQNLRLDQLALDNRVLLFAVAVTVGTTLLFGLWPAWQVSRNVSLTLALSGSTRGSSDSGQTRRARSGLVVAQVALALMLLAGAGLLIRSFANLQQIKLGFEPRNLLLMDIALPEIRYDTDEKGNRFYEQLLERTRALPGVEDVATVINAPQGNSSWSSSYHITGTPEPAPGRELNAECNAVTADYFKTMRIPLLRGRSFNDEDKADGPIRIVVDEAFAKKHFPNDDPIGKPIDNNTVPTGPNEPAAPPMTIVGVVGTVRTDLDRAPDFVQAYYHSAQSRVLRRTLVVRTKTSDPLQLATAIKREVLGIDPDQSVSGVESMESSIGKNLASHRLTLTLFGLFAAIALLLAVLGLYSVMALNVAHRTREMGIRMALGAERRSILQLVLRQGLNLVAVGLGVGLLGALGLARLMRSLLFGVGAVDPLVLAAVAFVLATAAAVACLLPARRATRVDPIVALRTE